MPANKSLALIDWKRWGAFIGTEYRLQLGGYGCCPKEYDRITQQSAISQPPSYGMVCWIGEQGVQAKLVMNQEELAEAGAMFCKAAELALYASEHHVGKPFTPSRYKHPLNPSVNLWSVTEVTKAIIAKDGLLNWYHKKGVEGMVKLVQEHLPLSLPKEELTVEMCLELLEEHKLRPMDLRDAAGVQGTTMHKMADGFLSGKSVDLTHAPEWQQSFMTKFAMWTQSVGLEPVSCETMVYHDEPPLFAGTRDCLAWVKTSWIEEQWERLAKKEEGVAA